MCASGDYFLLFDGERLVPAVARTLPPLFIDVLAHTTPACSFALVSLFAAAAVFSRLAVIKCVRRGHLIMHRWFDTDVFTVALDEKHHQVTGFKPAVAHCRGHLPKLVINSVSYPFFL